jgi:hypothetical protein
MIVGIEEFKSHLNIIDDISECEEKYLYKILLAAHYAVEKAINRKFRHKEGDDVKIEVMILGANLYQNREGTTHTSVSEVPLTFSFLNSLNKNYNDRKGILFG